MHDDRKLQAIGLWLLDLMEMTKGGREPPSPHKISLYTEQLAEMFPMGAFTAGSLRAVCFEQEYFPAFDTVRARVRQWWHEHMPSGSPLIGFSGGPALDDNDRAWVTRYYKRIGEIRIEGDPLENSADPAIRVLSKTGNLESLVKDQSPRGWESISGVRHEHFGREPTVQEKAAVSRSVDAAVNSLSKAKKPPTFQEAAE